MPFEFEKQKIEDVILVKPKVFGDNRGFFMESYKKSDFYDNGIAVEFNQDKRAELSNKIVQIGNDDVAFSYVAHLTKGYAMKSNVSGFRQTSSDYYELNKDMDIK